MKLLVLLCAALLPACASNRPGAVSPPQMAVAYHDLALDTKAGRAELAMRVQRSALAFCRAYDPMDPQTRFDVRLASDRNCPGAAAILLAQHMPASVRAAFRAGQRGE